MHSAALDFLIRNQSFAFLIVGLALSTLLYRWLFRPFFGLIKDITDDLTKGQYTGSANLGPLFSQRPLEISSAISLMGAAPIRLDNLQFPRFFRKALFACAAFLLGVVSIPAAAGVYSWLHRYGVVSYTAWLPAPAPARPLNPDAHTAIVLLHGWTGDATHTWSNFTNLMLSDRRLDGADIWPIDYPTYIANRHLELGQLSRWLYTDLFVPSLLPKYSKIVIIAHSLGGVVARDIYIKNVLSRRESPIKMIISIGSPFLGAPLSGIARALGVNSDYLAEMQPSSSYISTLDSNWGSLGAKPLSLCIWSPVDGVVTHDSAVHQCECDKSYPQWRHTELEKPISRDDLRYRTPIGSMLLHTDPTRIAPCD